MAAISTSSLQTSGSSDMPYMICDVLVVFLERHVLSYDLSHFSHSRCYLVQVQKTHFSRFFSSNNANSLAQNSLPTQTFLSLRIYFFPLVNTRSSIVIYFILPYSEPTVIDIIWSIVEQLKRDIFLSRDDGTNNRIAWNFYENL